MRKLVESTLVSLDGVIGSPDRWSPFDNEARQLALETLDRSDALLLGRVTYEYFRANWGAATGDPYIDRINAMPKYIASRSLTKANWNATLLGSDIVGEIERLKAGPGKDLIKYGTSRLDDTLLRAQLIDELRPDTTGEARVGRGRFVACTATFSCSSQSQAMERTCEAWLAAARGASRRQVLRPLDAQMPNSPRS